MSNYYEFMTIDKMKVKFREIKAYCKQMVKQYKERTSDNRHFPEYLIRTLASDGSQGEVHFYRKQKAREAEISEERIHYETFAELGLILESLGNEW